MGSRPREGMLGGMTPFLAGVAAMSPPALGYSITANLDGNSQLVLQCFVGEDETVWFLDRDAASRL